MLSLLETQRHQHFRIRLPRAAVKGAVREVGCLPHLCLALQIDKIVQKPAIFVKGNRGFLWDIIIAPGIEKSPTWGHFWQTHSRVWIVFALLWLWECVKFSTCEFWWQGGRIAAHQNILLTWENLGGLRHLLSGVKKNNNKNKTFSNVDRFVLVTLKTSTTTFHNFIGFWYLHTSCDF